MKAALLAGLSVLVLAGAASAQTTIIEERSVVGAPALIAVPGSACAPAMTTREITFPATYPGGIIHVAPVAVPAYAFDYGCPTMDYSMDYTWGVFGPYSDLTLSGG